MHGRGSDVPWVHSAGGRTAAAGATGGGAECTPKERLHGRGSHVSRVHSARGGALARRAGGGGAGYW
ncbi:hypothetical protein GCM10010988_16890 [Cnuibacter physcomitrellae]|nr:hypothetical protein GCM10010988_16890 [Cnuibacter physcomitrellae]